MGASPIRLSQYTEHQNTVRRKSMYIPTSESCSFVSDSLRPHRLDSPWNSPGKNTGVVSLSIVQGIFPTQVSNPGLPHCRQILYKLSHRQAQEYQNGQAIPFPADHLDPGIELGSPALQVDSLPAELPEKSICRPNTSNFKLRHRRINYQKFKTWKPLINTPDKVKTDVPVQVYIQREVSQKKKIKYHILTHIYGIQKNGTE